MGMAVPAAVAAYLQQTIPPGEPVYSARLAADAIVVFCCAVILWRVRNDPSV
jgi:hypothetical protein